MINKTNNFAQTFWKILIISGNNGLSTYVGHSKSNEQTIFLN